MLLKPTTVNYNEIPVFSTGVADKLKFHLSRCPGPSRLDEFPPKTLGLLRIISIVFLKREVAYNRGRIFAPYRMESGIERRLFDSFDCSRSQGSPGGSRAPNDRDNDCGSCDIYVTPL